jgi:DNA mismatch repair protein MSH5
MGVSAPEADSMYSFGQDPRLGETLVTVSSVAANSAHTNNHGHDAAPQIDVNPSTAHRGPGAAVTVSSTALVSETMSDSDTIASGTGTYLAAIQKLYSSHPVIGIAYYDAEDEVIYCGQLGSWDAVTCLKDTLNITAILTPSKHVEPFFQFLQQNELDGKNPYNVVSCKPSSFNYDKAKYRLRSLHYGSVLTHSETAAAASAGAVSDSENKSHLQALGPGHGALRSEDHQMLQLLSRINLDNVEMTQAAGGLLSYMLQNRIVSQLEDAYSPIHIKDIRNIELEHAVHVDRFTRDALSVFVDESIGHRHKEGLSLFGLMDRNVTTRGRRLLRHWFMHPTRHVATLQHRFDHIDFFAHSVNTELVSEFRSMLANVKDIPGILSRFRNVQVKLTDWTSLHMSLQHMISIHQLVTEYAQNQFAEDTQYQATHNAQVPDSVIPIFRELKELQIDGVHTLYAVIHGAIDFAQSKSVHSGGRVVIQHGVHEQLDALKLQYENLDSFLTDVAREDMAVSQSTVIL